MPHGGRIIFSFLSFCIAVVVMIGHIELNLIQVLWYKECALIVDASSR
jgi:hypothetical protein